MAFILTRYIGRHFMFNIAVALGVILAIAGLIDLIEMFRRTASKESATFLITMQMGLLRLPHLAEKLMPYGIMIGAMMTLLRMTRSSELIVARAAGVSVWRILSPALLIAIVLGAASITLLNPLSAATLAKYERMESRYINETQQIFSVSASGLWLKHVEPDIINVKSLNVGSYILQARHIEQTDMSLSDVIIFLYNEERQFIGRIEASDAILRDRFWELRNVMLSIPGRIPDHMPNYVLPTELNIKQIQNSFAEPSTLSFWQLSDFIATLEKAGFSAIRHKLHWYATLITPLVFCTMVIVAAVFSLRLPRRGKTILMVFGAVSAGFVLNFLTGLSHAFGYAGSLPIEIAVIAPYALGGLLSIIVLLHVEDG